MDISFQVKRISSDWPLIVGDLPTQLNDALAAFDAADAAQPPSTVVDVGALTADTAADTVATLTAELAAADYFATARRNVVDGLAYRVLTEAAAALPQLLERLEPEFSACVSEFCAAVDRLPDDRTSEGLMAAGGAAVDDYHRAVRAQNRLKKFDGFVSELSSLPGYTSRPDKVLRLLRPTTRNEYRTLLSIKDVYKPHELSPLWSYAAETGIEFALNDPATAKQIEADINAQPVERNPNLRFVRW